MSPTLARVGAWDGHSNITVRPTLEATISHWVPSTRAIGTASARIPLGALAVHCREARISQRAVQHSDTAAGADEMLATIQLTQPKASDPEMIVEFVNAVNSCVPIGAGDDVQVAGISVYVTAELLFEIGSPGRGSGR